MLRSSGYILIWFTPDHIYFQYYSCSLTLTIQDCQTPGHVGSPLLPYCILPGPDTVVRNVCDCSAQLVRLTVLAYLLDELSNFQLSNSHEDQGMT